MSETYLSLWRGEIPANQSRKTMTQILEEVAAKHCLSVEDLKGPRKFRIVAHARQEVMYRCRQETRLSLPQIGERLGGRDHTTVLYGARAYEARRTLERHPKPRGRFTRAMA